MEEGEPFEPDDDLSFRLPPAPDDRLWRHPSELSWTPPASKRRRSLWPIAVASGLTGAILTVGLLVVSGTLEDRVELRPTVVRETVRPVAFDASNGGGPDVARLAGAVTPAIVRLEVERGSRTLGSGVLFRDDGHVLTNAHLVQGALRIVAVLDDGRSHDAHVVGADAGTDMAVVKIDADGPFPVALLGTTDGMAVGQPAVAIGSTVGLDGVPAVSVGVVSALGREIAAPDGSVLQDMVQTDASIAPESSGGALVDSRGSVVGITTAFGVDADADGHRGLGFATPVDVAQAVADDLLAVGRVRSVWLGVKGVSAPDGGGVSLAGVSSSSPAAAAGLRAGDVVRRVDNHPVMSMSQLRIALRRHHPGERVAVVYDRDGDRRSARIVLAERDS